jgi:DNA-binding response OmpR family regulator
MFGIALSLDGYAVEQASDGHAALILLDQITPAALVLDLGLPRVSGFDVLADVVGHAHTRSIPIIVVTARDVQPSQVAGAACVLRKPVTPDRLVNTVRACVLARGRRHVGADAPCA